MKQIVIRPYSMATWFTAAIAISTLILLTHFAAAQTNTKKYDLNNFIASWSKTTGVVITDEVKNAIAKNMARRFGNNAKKVGFTSVETSDLSRKIAASEPVIAMASGEYGKLIGDSASNTMSIEFRNEGQVNLVDQTYETRAINDLLSSYPTIYIEVKPTPPRDYTIFINDREYATTEKSEYGVQGKVRVSVTRAGKQPCMWTGTMTGTQKKKNTCSF